MGSSPPISSLDHSIFCYSSRTQDPHDLSPYLTPIFSYPSPIQLIFPLLLFSSSTFIIFMSIILLSRLCSYRWFYLLLALEFTYQRILIFKTSWTLRSHHYHYRLFYLSFSSFSLILTILRLALQLSIYCCLSSPLFLFYLFLPPVNFPKIHPTLHLSQYLKPFAAFFWVFFIFCPIFLLYFSSTFCYLLIFLHQMIIF